MRAGNRARRALREQFGNACQRCGYNRCSRALHFHHADASEKAAWSGARKDANVAELRAHPERFQLLCANCHIEEHEALDAANRPTTPCLYCGKAIRREAAKVANGRNHYCDTACQHAARTIEARNRVSLPARFWKRVEQTDGCWHWTGDFGGKHPRIYAKKPDGTNTVLSAMRVSYELHGGALAPGQSVRQTCGNRRCVNPAHLALRYPV